MFNQSGLKNKHILLNLKLKKMDANILVFLIRAKDIKCIFLIKIEQYILKYVHSNLKTVNV